MAHPSKVKGDRFERDVVDYLRTHGHPYAERAYGAGRDDDQGDIDGLPGWTIQCRNTTRIELAVAMNDAERQRTAGPRLTRWACAVLKRRGKQPGDAYVVMSLATFAALTQDE